MKLIVGLGNPGKAYAHSRHNAGFICLKHLASYLRVSFDNRECHSRTTMSKYHNQDLLLARPSTFMNYSGQAAACLSRKYHLTPADIIVIHDDLDLSLGRIRLRRGGASAGHKGVQSIIDCLGNSDFWRLRIGIGRPAGSGEEDVVNYVLGNFTSEEAEIMDKTAVRAVQALLCLVSDGPEIAMNIYNRSQDNNRE